MKWSDVENSLFSPEEQAETNHVLSIVTAVIERRKELCLTQRDLAKKTGLTQSAIGRFESLGAVPRIDTLWKITNILGLELSLQKLEKKHQN
jgi:transcriptional regulator with XRE-family HTH domain